MSKALSLTPLEKRLAGALRERFGSSDRLRVVRAPYRVCPLGAHIDHQGGTVLGAAIEMGVSLLWRPGRTPETRIVSLDYERETAFSVRDVPDPPREKKEKKEIFWGDFAAGAAWILGRKYRLTRGIEGVIGGQFPVGGLSSSAAVALAYGVALRVANDLPLDSWELVRFAREAENKYVGVSCGLLDPATIRFAEKKKLVRIDCLEEKVELVPPGRAMTPFGVAIVFSGVERALKRSGYNDRVKECGAAAAAIARAAGCNRAVELLVEISRSDFERFKEVLPGNLRKRAEHFFSETERVEKGLSAWRAGKLEEFGALVNESGLSSVVNYEAGSPETIRLWETLREAPGVFGTRFSGGGFGGAVIALLDPERRRETEEWVRGRYLSEYPGFSERFRFEFSSIAHGLKWGEAE